MSEPPGSEMWPESLSCTYCRKAAFVASFAVFRRLAERSAYHWAVVAVWCRSFDSVMCSKGDDLWAQSGRMNFARMRCGSR